VQHVIVIDASVLANLVADDGPDGEKVRRAVEQEGEAAVPDLADVETVAVLRKWWLAGQLDERRFAAALDDLGALPFRRYPGLPLMRRAFELRANVYKAAYVALAEALGCALLTADRRLQRAAGPTCPVRLLTSSTPRPGRAPGSPAGR
jgi:predicted nucleic acid-binding protein